MKDLSALQRDILFVLAGLDDPNGQEIKKELRRSQGRELLSGPLYSNLDELVDRGLVAKAPKNGRANAYNLTEAGCEALSRQCQWERSYVSVEKLTDA